MKRLSLPLMVGFFLSSIAFCAFTVSAETQVIFSGKWSFNMDKSKAAEGTSFSGSEITLDILQNQETITITKTIYYPVTTAEIDLSLFPWQHFHSAKG